MPRISEETLAAHRQRAEAKLLDAWADLLREHGYEATTLAMVAERAGMARNTVYNYFPSKEALLQAYVEREVARFMSQVTAAVDATVGARSRLEVLIREQLGYFSHAGTALHPLASSLGPAAQATLAGHFEPIQRLVGRILREGIHEGELRPLDIEHATNLVIATLDAFRKPLATGQLSNQHATELALDLLLHGLAAR
jgi:AcrR family transcriptional regulator